MEQITKREVSFGCVDSPGFRTSGVSCDIRGKGDGRLDLAIIYSEASCSAAGVFTRNRMAAAPIRLCRDLVSKGGLFRGIVANSGNANACTGELGLADAKAMQACAAKALDCTPEEIFVGSTGRIGEPLPMDRLCAGIERACKCLNSDPDAGAKAADAILTSDTRRKVCSLEVRTSAGLIHLSGIAKGAGMIEPNMATMLAFLCTDASVSSANLQAALSECVQTSFNAISVDGDESTNDTVLLLANGMSNVQLKPGNADWTLFKRALQSLCDDLAAKIVGDGEKITKVVEICIEGAKDAEDASLAARAIANSLLVKASWYGNDPNWGRLLDAVGYSGALVSEETVHLWYEPMVRGGAVPVFIKGKTYPEKKSSWQEIVGGKRFRIRMDLGHGEASCRLWSTDLTAEYVNFNKSE